MAVLAILQPDARASARLTGALGDVHHLVELPTWRAVRSALEKGAVDGCLVDPDHPSRNEARRHIAQVRGRHPEAAIMVHVHRPLPDDLFDFGGLGVDGIISADAGTHALRADVDHAFTTARGGRVARMLRGRIAEPGPAALAWAMIHASGEPTVDKMATAFGVSPRGMREMLNGAGLPNPARILLWGRLLLAGARLATDRRSVEDVAFSLGYATSTSLARAMKKQTGFTPREITERGGMQAVIDALLPPAPSPRRAPPSARDYAPIPRFGAFLALIAMAGCAALGVGGSGVDRAAIEAVLQSPGIEQMHVGILAVDAESGRTLYERNSEKKFVPASNQKILVTAAAMTMLGPDHRFRNEVWAVGARKGAHLEGDLVVVGSGDPTLSARFWPSGTAALAALADSVRRSGLKRVTGGVVVDASAWDSATIGPTWEVEDLRYAYGSTGGAFAIDEGEVEVVVAGGPAVGAPARVRWTPRGTDTFVRSRVRTSAPGSRTRVTPYYLPESRRLVLDGRAGYRAVDTLSFALRDPVRQASAALARSIEDSGIELGTGWRVAWSEGERVGESCEAGRLEACPTARRVALLASPPLSEIVAAILEPSQNWMTEQLIRSLPAADGARGSWSDGTAAVEAFLFEHVGVDTLDVSARDGSGLSAYNLVTPRALVRVLRFMRDGPHGTAYRDAMAEPGEEGSSLERRLAGLEGRVHAKTGTISNVNSLSGYLVREDGREVVFSVLTNGSGLPASYVRAAIDDIVRALAH